jgi:hypothetical protein
MKQATHNQRGFGHTFGLVLVLGITIVAAGSIIFLIKYDVISAPDTILVFKKNTNSNEATNTNNAAVNNSNTNQNTNQVLGGDRDAHGCIGSAGYTWCEIKAKCLRTWEETCAESNNNANSNQSTNANTGVSQTDIIGQNGYTFETESYMQPEIDSRLIATDKNGIKKTLIESTRTAAGLAKDHGLYKISSNFPNIGNEIYLADSLLFSEGMGQNIWRYSLIDGSLNKLVNISLANVEGYFFFSTDMKRAVHAPFGGETGNSQKLSLFDFTTDKVTELVNLSGNETLNSGWDGYDALFDISWTAGSKIKYSVYNQNTGNINTGNHTMKTIIATREVSVSQ